MILARPTKSKNYFSQMVSCRRPVTANARSAGDSDSRPVQAKKLASLSTCSDTPSSTA